MFVVPFRVFMTLGQGSSQSTSFSISQKNNLNDQTITTTTNQDQHGAHGVHTYRFTLPHAAFRAKATPLWRHITAKRNNMAEPLYCVCRQTYDPSQFMIQCDSCEEWYHGRLASLILKLLVLLDSKIIVKLLCFSCVGIEEYQASDIERYHCPQCALLHGPLTRKYTSLYRWYQACNLRIVCVMYVCFNCDFAARNVCKHGFRFTEIYNLISTQLSYRCMKFYFVLVFFGAAHGRYGINIL